MCHYKVSNYVCSIHSVCVCVSVTDVLVQLDGFNFNSVVVVFLFCSCYLFIRLGMTSVSSSLVTTISIPSRFKSPGIRYLQVDLMPTISSRVRFNSMYIRYRYTMNYNHKVSITKKTNGRLWIN